MKSINLLSFGFYKGLEAETVWSGAENNNDIYIKNYIDDFLEILEGNGNYNEFLIGSKDGTVYSINSSFYKILKNKNGLQVENYKLHRINNNIIIEAENVDDIIFLNNLISTLLSYDFSNIFNDYNLTKRLYTNNEKDFDCNFSKNLFQLIRIQANPSYVKWLINNSNDLFYNGDIAKFNKLQSQLLTGVNITSIKSDVLLFEPVFKVFNSKINAEIIDNNVYKKEIFVFMNSDDDEFESNEESYYENGGALCDVCGGDSWCGTNNCPFDCT